MIVPLDPNALDAEATIRGMTQAAVTSELKERLGCELASAARLVHGVDDGVAVVFEA